MTTTQIPPSQRRGSDVADGRSSFHPLRLIGRVTRAEWIVAGVVAAVMVVLTVAEPGIVEAPVENANTLAFTAGGTILAALALVLLLRFDVPPVVRIVVLLVPFALVNWWLISPFFLDEVVDEQFSTSIAAQLETGDDPASPAPGEASESTGEGSSAPAPRGGSPSSDDPGAEVDQAPTGPVLLGTGTFVGLAGHSGTGDAGIFQDVDGSHVLRFENFDIENGPDLEVYLVPGADQRSLAAGSVHLGALKGNVGDQTYDLPADLDLASGTYTALVWCDAFDVEFVGATLTIG